MRTFSTYLTRILALVFVIISVIACEEVLLQEDISNQEVSLLAPADGASINFTSVNFNWNALEYATSYQLQIATPNFSNAIQIVDDVVLDSLTEYTTELTPNEYQWRVKAMNNAFETSFFSASFTVESDENFSENSVNLLSPEDGLIANNDTFILDWDDIASSTQYRVQIIDNVTTDVIQEAEVTTSSFDITFPEGDNTWQVRGEKDNESTLYSARSLLIDLTSPNMPLLTSPVDGDISTSQDVTFTYTREPIAGSVEFDSIYIYKDASLTDLEIKEEITDTYSTTLKNNTYFWVMSSFDKAGNISEMSSVFSFTIN